MTGDLVAERDIVFGIDGLTGLAVFSRRSVAVTYQRIGDAAGDGTWGGVKAVLPVAEYQDWLDQAFEERETDPTYQPSDDEPFNFDQVGPFSDGDWPLPPLWDALEWMPDDVKEAYGRVVTTTLNGDYLEIEPVSMDAVAEALKTRGYACSRDDALVRNWR